MSAGADGMIINMLAEAIAKQVSAEVKKVFDSAAPRVEKMLYDISEAAIYLGRSESAVRHLIDKRELLVVRIGTRVQVSKRDMDELIDDRRS